MITDVKLSGTDTTVGEVRALFTNEHVHSAVVVSGGRLMVVVDRDDVQAGCSDDAAAVTVGRSNGRVVAPDTDLQAAQELMLRTGRRRLAVVGSDRTFLGLLCLKRTRRGFCSDSTVLARSTASRVGTQQAQHLAHDHGPVHVELLGSANSGLRVGSAARS